MDSGILLGSVFSVWGLVGAYIFAIGVAVLITKVEHRMNVKKLSNMDCSEMMAEPDEIVDV